MHKTHCESPIQVAGRNPLITIPQIMSKEFLEAKLLTFLESKLLSFFVSENKDMRKGVFCSEMIRILPCIRLLPPTIIYFLGKKSSSYNAQKTLRITGTSSRPQSPYYNTTHHVKGVSGGQVIHISSVKTKI